MTLTRESFDECVRLRTQMTQINFQLGTYFNRDFVLLYLAFVLMHSQTQVHPKLGNGSAPVEL